MLNRYISKRPRSSFWQLRIPVPKDVQLSFGRDVVTKTLREHDRARAEEKALPFLADLIATWASLRAIAENEQMSPLGSGKLPTEAQLTLLAGEAFKQGFSILREKLSTAVGFQASVAE